MCSLSDRADRAHASFSSARAELLSAIGELLQSDAWLGDGADDLAPWLAARWQISIRTAREYVRDAEALAERPELNDALSTGAISIDQCKALTKIGDADTDGVMLEALPYWTYSELEREARRQTARDLACRDGGTYLRMRHTNDERFLRGEFQLRPEDGALLIDAIDARIPTGTAMRNYEFASARALVELVKGSTSPSQQRPVVIVTDGAGELGSGGVVGPETVERISCDASIQDVGATRLTPAVPAATRRVVEARDGGRCTFPGCEKDIYLECHHIVRRADGGSNDATNLQLVCWKHHKLIHEDGWTLRGEAGTKATWVKPDGSAFQPRIRIVEDTS